MNFPKKIKNSGFSSRTWAVVADVSSARYAFDRSSCTPLLWAVWLLTLWIDSNTWKCVLFRTPIHPIHAADFHCHFGSGFGHWSPARLQALVVAGDAMHRKRKPHASFWLYYEFSSSPWLASVPSTQHRLQWTSNWMMHLRHFAAMSLQMNIDPILALQLKLKPYLQFHSSSNSLRCAFKFPLPSAVE